MNQKRFVNITVIVVVILLAGVAGYFTLIKKQGPASQQSTTKDETANWKTFREEEMGFEIKYPQTLMQGYYNGQVVFGNSLNDINGGVPVVAIQYMGTDFNFSDAVLGEDISKRPRMGLDEFMKLASYNDAFQNIKHTTLNTYNAYEIDFENRETDLAGHTLKETKDFGVLVEYKNHAFKIVFNHAHKEDLSLFELDILRSFKILK